MKHWLNVFIVLLSTLALGQSRNVIFNGVLASDEDIAALESYYQTYLPDSSYWYDPVSGLWGLEGYPAAGQILPRLELGGPLRADASGGNTGVFINGRELHVLEALYLYQLFGAVYPGYYWMDEQGNTGVEGGPAFVNLFTAASGGGNGGGNGGYTSRTSGGLMGSDGNCFYYNDPETGSSYMPPGC